MNNIVTLETTLQLNEYNGFGTSPSDYFVITEVALAGGYKFGAIGPPCGETPDQLFLQGSTSSGSAGGSFSAAPIQCIGNGTDTISINPSEIDTSTIVQGDQIKIVGPNDTRSQESINQVSPFYLVITKATGGRDITLDRTPVDINNNPIIGPIGVYRSTLRLFSQRVLSVPFSKTSDFQITCQWQIVYN